MGGPVWPLGYSLDTSVVEAQDTTLFVSAPTEGSRLSDLLTVNASGMKMPMSALLEVDSHIPGHTVCTTLPSRRTDLPAEKCCHLQSCSAKLSEESRDLKVSKDDSDNSNMASAA